MVPNLASDGSAKRYEQRSTFKEAQASAAIDIQSPKWLEVAATSNKIAERLLEDRVDWSGSRGVIFKQGYDETSH